MLLNVGDDDRSKHMLFLWSGVKTRQRRADLQTGQSKARSESLDAHDLISETVHSRLADVAPPVKPLLNRKRRQKFSVNFGELLGKFVDAPQPMNLAFVVSR